MARAADYPRPDGAALNPYTEHDACGVGFVARTSGEGSHQIVALALEALSRVKHRGAASTDNSGDGAGVLVQLPRRFLRAEAVALGLPLRDGMPFAVGQLFLPPADEPLARAKAIAEQALAAEGLPCLGWRAVPIDVGALGPTARASCPALRQLYVGRPADLPSGAEADELWERRLYLARRAMEVAAEEAGIDLYVCSLSARTLVYKALLNGSQLGVFYPDLLDPGFESAICVFHQRYSTNTLPSWSLAQPFRLLAHNGEINTLWGNRNAMQMRAPLIESPVWPRDRAPLLRDVIWKAGSDSASLDNAMELFVRSGRSPLHTAMMLMPQAWEKYPDIEIGIKSFYEYHQCIHEPWDGPAAISFSDGITACAVVDRNGLRPCRYKVTRDGLVVVGSEVGLVDLDPADVVQSGKVGPGEVLVVDTVRNRVLHNLEAKREVARRRPYVRWVQQYMAVLEPDPSRHEPAPEPDRLAAQQRAFGYGFEDVRHVLEPMAAGATDAVWSMGDDTPIPPLAREAPPVYAYLRQRFAQVTNPPIDPLREQMVMSLRMHLGRRGSPLVERPTHARMLRLEHPVLMPAEMAALRNVPGFSAVVLDATWPVAQGTAGLKPALLALATQAERAARAGATILIVSDRALSPERAPMPLLLAIGAVRLHLVRTGLRARVGLVAEAGDATDIHHLATLIGYGAEAVHPWLALASVGPAGSAPQQRYRAAAEKGLLKIMSKMGIATLASYCGGQKFEALGLGPDVIATCFAGTTSPIGGVGFEELAEDVLARHRAAYSDETAASLPDQGRIRFRKEGEQHAWAPPTVVALQKAVAPAAGEAAYATYLERIAAARPTALRDLLRVRAATPIPLDRVEPVEAVMQRFVSSAMSLGALSPEAHHALTVAMNRIGARSNSGEGGEDPAHYVRQGTDRADNRIKQVASARFGVTAEYLARAEELEIKVVQGAKPGEGGQLPGIKVTDLIARLRHAVPGITLISPPPHHDIYSIEDLAQLIHDLKTVNPRARVGVKLVSEAGVGTVAAGVCKAYADYVLIAGHSGGTGASPLSSIKYAGSPWELGLAEAQATLVRNGLRHRIEVRTDGGLRTGRDVVIAALLGAEAYGFGTAPLVALGCAMARQCHLNSCPTGVATQRDDLRARFTGTPEAVVRYFTLVAEEVRAILAGLGVHSLGEVIGRADLLERVDRPELPRAQMLDLNAVLVPAAGTGARKRTEPRNDRPGVTSLDREILRDLGPHLEAGTPFSGQYAIRNHHLSVGAAISGLIAERHGDAGLPAGTVRLAFTGSAGQSFGAFLARGVALELEGEANDYVGKGLSGGEIAIRPFATAAYAGSHEDLIIGNTVCYGATAGRLYAAGQAGDRCAVRNSGAVLVVEGVGNHGCEYMTGGIVAVLGRAGRNFGAGMSNGVAYVLDEQGSFPSRVNYDMVGLEGLDDADEQVLLALIHEHVARTGSARARRLLADWVQWRPLFRRVAPKGGARLLERVRGDYLATLAPAGAAP